MGEIGDLGPQGSVVFGVFVGLASTSIQSLGLTLQRKSHILEDERGLAGEQRPPYRRRRWQLGMFMFIVSNLVGSTIQITTLPLPVLSTLQASGLVFNSICATLILKEHFTRLALAGTVLVTIGAAVIAIFGAIGESAHDLSALLVLLGRPQFLVWLAGTFLLVIGTLVGARMLKTLHPQYGVSPRARLARGMAFGFVSGILSAHTLLLAKSAVELVVRTIVDHVNQFNRWQSWVIVIGLVVLALSQLYFLHRGLKLCSTSVLYPFVFCIYNVIAILDGLIYFNQASRLSLMHGLLVLLGTVILLCGVVCLSWRLNEDAAARTPLTPTALAPGAPGYLDSDSSSLASGSDYDSDEDATESTLLIPRLRPRQKDASPSPSPSTDLSRTNGKTAITGTRGDPLQRQEYGTVLRRSVHWDDVPSRTGEVAEDADAGSTASPRRQQMARRLSRSQRQAAAEVGAIWDELQEEGGPPRDPVSPTAVMTTASPRRRDSSGSMVRVTRSPSPLAQFAPDAPLPEEGSDADADTDAAFDEQPPPPLVRSSTGRSYRPRRRRRATSAADQAGRQGAEGGWWRMRRWLNIGDRNRAPSGVTEGANGAQDQV